jgi:hypothetical protein
MRHEPGAAEAKAQRMYEVYFRQRVERGLRELESGKTVSHRMVKRSLAQWLQSVAPDCPPIR